jgi:hypothetical protein
LLRRLSEESSSTAQEGVQEESKRAAEIQDGKLFTQPEESHLGECPICCLPSPLDWRKWSVNTCCSKMICIGCSHANSLHEEEQGLEQRCPFCRELMPGTEEKKDKNEMERVKVNDSVAIRHYGRRLLDEGDIEGAFENWAKAAVLGDVIAHFQLSIMYYTGGGIEKDMKRAVYHLEEAAIGVIQ